MSGLCDLSHCFAVRPRTASGRILRTWPLPGAARVLLLIQGAEILMRILANLLTALVAALHIYFLVLEMFLWDQPRGRRIFGTTPEFAAASKALAANQGLYNGFLAAGLVWSLVGSPMIALPMRTFFLGCVVIAGVYGGLTASRKILAVQAVPAALALAVTLLIR